MVNLIKKVILVILIGIVIIVGINNIWNTKYGIEFPYENTSNNVESDSSNTDEDYTNTSNEIFENYENSSLDKGEMFEMAEDVEHGAIATDVYLKILRIITYLAIILFLVIGINYFIKKEKNKGIINIIAAVVFFVIHAFLSVIKLFKPIIYIYPEEELEVNIKLKNKEKLTCTYPKYENEWKVMASPNGDLIDLKTNRKLYALYWEGLNTNKQKFEEGFIVEGEKTIKFLEEKLEILGLNEREAEEFIIYWLPQMEHNKYNYVRFETIDEINENMPLEINPKPETLIRINMVFKPLRKPIKIKEQQIEKVTRKGYTIVEWGGSKV